MKDINSQYFILRDVAKDLWKLLGDLEQQGFSMEVFDHENGTSRKVHCFANTEKSIQIILKTKETT